MLNVLKGAKNQYYVPNLNTPVSQYRVGGLQLSITRAAELDMFLSAKAGLCRVFFPPLPAQLRSTCTVSSFCRKVRPLRKQTSGQHNLYPAVGFTLKNTESLTIVYGEESFVRSEESTLQDDFHRPLQVSVAYEHNVRNQIVLIHELELIP